MTSFSLTDNFIGDYGTAKLASAIGSNEVLETVNLSRMSSLSHAPVCIVLIVSEPDLFERNQLARQRSDIESLRLQTALAQYA